MNRVGGIVLCGGRSSRMGRPKAWLPFGPEVLLQRVVRILSEVVETIVVVASPGQDLPTLPINTIVVQDEAEFLGPLNGIATGLRAIEGRVDCVYAASCDAPLLRPAFIRRVVERLEGFDVCIPEQGGFKHPLAAAYRTSVLRTVEKLLKMNRLRPVLLTELLPTRILGPTDFTDVDSKLDSLRNMNTPEEYEAVVAEFEQRSAAD